MTLGYHEFGNAKEYSDIGQDLLGYQSTEAVQESRSILQGTLDAIVDGIIVFDYEGDICHYNCKFIEMWDMGGDFLGTKDQGSLLALLLKKVKHPEIYSKKESTLYTEPERECYDIFELIDGRYFESYSKTQWFDNRINGRVVSFRDITERKRLEKEMVHLEGLHLIGKMAAGIGHEVRNPMTTIRGFLQMLAKKKECLKYSEYYKLMIGELDRANSIISDFLSVAKERSNCCRAENLNRVIDSLLPLMEADAIVGNNYIKIELGEIPEMILDEKEIRQLILNFVRNGLDSMSSGGYLTIKTYMEDNQIVLAIKDQGSGIIPEVLARIGTPFFTTKEQGTGLGLAISYSIVARHQGTVQVETSDKGTTFFIRFTILNSIAPCIVENNKDML